MLVMVIDHVNSQERADSNKRSSTKVGDWMQTERTSNMNTVEKALSSVVRDNLAQGTSYSKEVLAGTRTKKVSVGKIDGNAGKVM